MPTATYDAIVIGSGISGGFAAKELGEKGLKTLVLEAGRPTVPEKDYVEHVPVWDVRFRGLRDRKSQLAKQPIQRQCYACDEWASKFFVNDNENPYTTDSDKPFSWIRGRQVGGKSIMWGRQTYRWSDLDFEANLKEGIAIDWPIRYADIAPWYDYVEEFAGISGQAEGLPHLPDGRFLPAMKMNCAEENVRDAIAKHFPGERIMTIGRCAVITRPHNGRHPCHYCGPCHRGCIARAYFSSVNATLPVALATGNVTLRPFSVAHSLMFDSKSRKVSGVRVIDAQSRQALDFKGKIIFLCASTLESARLLLNSATPEFPNGLANSSGQLGRNLMDHIMGGGASGRIPGNEDKTDIGDRPNGIYVPRFRNVKSKSHFLRGYGYQGGAGRRDWDRGINLSGFGADLKRSLKKPGPWHFSMGGFGEMLPNPNNYVEVDKQVKDAWGIPALKIHCKYGENEWALMKDASIAAAEMLAAAGAEGIETFIEDNAPGLAIHEMGTARMGKDPKTSVLNSWNQAHDVANLFVTDGSCMVSSSCVNPSITYMALTARACNHAVELMKRGEI